MKKLWISIFLVGSVAMIIACNDTTASNDGNESKDDQKDKQEKAQYEKMGYESEVAWGNHLVTIVGCDDCHSPKKMTEKGPIPDPEKRLMGHPADLPPPEGDWKAITSKGNVLTNSHLTAFVGPWGVTYSANITSDETGIGRWTKDQFFKSIREGKHKGLDGGRPVLPPMPWFNLAKMTDAELSAVYAFLQTTKPIENIVPQPELFEKPKQAMK